MDDARSAIAIVNDLQLVGTVFAALFGVACGSFLNVFLIRFPAEESIATPRSHCRNCEHTLIWWENIPVLSWIMLRGRCRKCSVWIGIRYPLIELAVGLLWALCWIRFGVVQADMLPATPSLVSFAGFALLCWLLLALAILDAEYFWLPDWLTIPGIGLGLAFAIVERIAARQSFAQTLHSIWLRILAILAAAAVVLIIRLAYWLIRHREGMGLGDAKLMGLLGAWLGLRGALECFALAVFTAAAAAILWLAFLTIRRKTDDWAAMPLPLGTFLCAAALSEVFYPHWLWNWWLPGL